MFHNKLVHNIQALVAHMGLALNSDSIFTNQSDLHWMDMLIHYGAVPASNVLVPIYISGLREALGKKKCLASFDPVWYINH